MAGRVAGNGVGRNAYGVLVAAPEGKSYLEEIGIDGRIILRQIQKKY